VLPEIISDVEYAEFSKIKTHFDEISELQARIKQRTSELQESLKDKNHLEISAAFNSDKQLLEFKNKLDRVSTDLCNNLNKWFNEERLSKIILRQISFDSVLYAASLALARINPINTVDFATLDSIQPENMVPVSTRYIFDINSLVTLLTHENFSTLENPYVNKKFSHRDKLTILKCVQAKKNNGESIACHSGNPFPNDEPNLEATLALVQQLQQSTQLEFIGGGHAGIPYQRVVATDRNYIIAGAHMTLRSLMRQPISHGMFHRPRLNTAMMQTLDALRRDELRPAHLEGWPAATPFTASHGLAIIHLIRNEEVPATEAVNRVSGWTEDEILEQEQFGHEQRSYSNTP